MLGDPSKGRLINRCPIACRGPWTGLIIDDLFCVSCEPAFGHEAPSSTRPPASESLLKQAKAAYDAEGVPGSDNKDQFGERVFTVAGAQVDASPDTVASGKVLVGLPVPRRLALAQASLLVASGRWISEELASILAGCWVTALLIQAAPDGCHWAPFFPG